jgi:hypothetical protein
MHQNRHDVKSYVKLGYIMRNLKSSYSIVNITITQAFFSHVTVYGTTLTHGCEEGAYEDT